MSIVQISDLHICEKTRESLFNNFRKLKDEVGDLPIIICGDIFDKKTYCKGDDIETLHKIFDIFVDNTIYMIPGESDFEYGSSNNLLDNFKIERDSVRIITKNTELEISGKRVLFLPPTDYDGISEYIDSAEHYDYVVIYEKNKTLLKKYNIPNAKNYFCGGIHNSKQYVVGDNKYVYSGSMSRRFDERDYRSYIIWADKTPVRKFITVPNEKFYYYKSDRLHRQEISEPDGDSFVGTTNISFHFRKCTAAFIRTVKDKAADILKANSNISISYTDIIKSSERVSNITSLNGDTDFFGLDAQLAIISGKNGGSELEEMHKMYYKKYLGDGNSGQDQKSWRIDKMYWSNIFCYKDDNFLDFNDLHGLTTIIGKNGLGKTSLINVITIGLFGMLSYDNPKNPKDLTKLFDVICYTGSDRWNVVVYLSTTIGDKQRQYVIRRSGNDKGTELHFYEVLNPELIEKENREGNIRVVNNTKFPNETTQKSVSQIIGSARDFLKTNVMHQNTDYYVDGTPDEITDLVLSSSYFNNFMKIEEDVSNQISITKKLITKKKSEIKGAKDIVSDDTDTSNSERQEKLDNYKAERIRVLSILADEEKKYNNIPKFVGDIDRKDHTELTVFYKNLDSAKKYDTTKLDELSIIVSKLGLSNPEYFLRYAEYIILDIENYTTSLKKYNISGEEIQTIFGKAQLNSHEKVEEILTNSKLVPKFTAQGKYQKLDKNSAEYISYKKYLEAQGGFQNFGKIEDFVNKISKFSGENISGDFNETYFNMASSYDLSTTNFGNIVDRLEFDDSCECCIGNKEKLTPDPEIAKKLGVFVRTFRNGHYTDSVSAQNNIILADKIKFMKTIPPDAFVKIQNHNNWFVENKIAKQAIDDHVRKILHITPIDKQVLDYIRSMGVEKYREQLTQSLEKCDSLRKTSDELLLLINNTTKSIEYAEKINRSTKELESMVQKLEILENYIKLVQRDGICKNIIENYLITLNENINNILKCITDFTVSLSLDSDNLLNISIPEKKIKAKQCSGGQKFILDIAIRISLLNISKERPKFMIIDEGFGSLDVDHLENIQAFMKIIDEFYRSKKNWILFVSHIDELRDLSSNKISINTLNNRSCIFNVSPEIMRAHKRFILSLSKSKSKHGPSTEDLVFDEKVGKYHCKYCDYNYNANMIEKHVDTEKHKKNWIAAQPK